MPATKARWRRGLPTAGSGVGSVASSALLFGSHSVAVSPAAAASRELSALQAAASIGSPVQRYEDMFSGHAQHDVPSLRHRGGCTRP